MIARPYQEKSINGAARKIFEGKRKICNQLATGGGKTVIFSSITDRYIKKSGLSVLIAVHRIELLSQTRKALFNAFGIEAFLIKAGVRHIPHSQVYVCMVESVTNRIKKLADKNIGMVIIDECHIASFNKLHNFFPTQIILGFTATPLSSSKKLPVKMFYEDIVCGVDIPELIKDGHLCQNMTWAPKETVDRLSLAIKGNDFDDTVMAQNFSKPKYISNTVEAYKKWSKDCKAIIFNVNVAHSKEVNKKFLEDGFFSEHLDGTTPQPERKRILQWFKDTPDAILNNVGIATVGFDEPTIDTVIVNKATMSMPLWLQMCGRGARPTLSKSAFTVIDMGGNAITHGDWSQPRDWEDLFWNPPKPGEQGVAPVKSCPECEAIIPASTKICPYCGFKYDAKSVPVEVELHDYVMVTKNIDIEQIMRDNAHRKEYYPFFQIGRKLAKEAKLNIAMMTDEYANFILQLYFEKGKEWIKRLNQKKGTRKAFNKWHQKTAEDTLFTELEKSFPQWQRAPL
jgi:superfamily II DNA or RNA helicase